MKKLPRNFIVLYQKPVTLQCVNCKAVYEIRVIEEGEKATLPTIEFCPICSMPYNELLVEELEEIR